MPKKLKLNSENNSLSNVIIFILTVSLVILGYFYFVTKNQVNDLAKENNKMSEELVKNVKEVSTNQVDSILSELKTGGAKKSQKNTELRVQSAKDAKASNPRSALSNLNTAVVDNAGKIVIIPPAPAENKSGVKSTAKSAKPLKKPTLKANSKVAVKAQPVAKAISLATIRKGEGVQAAIYRQLMNDPSTYGYKSKMNKKQWAKNMARSISVKAGYVDLKSKHEIRVKTVGVEYRLVQKDGKTFVHEFNEGESQPSDINEVKEKFSEAVFHGLDKTHVQPYEYVYTP